MSVVNLRGKHINKARLLLGMTQQEAAFHIGVAESTLHRWEATNSQPRRTSVKCIVDFFASNGIDINDLLKEGARSVPRAQISKEFINRNRRV